MIKCTHCGDANDNAAKFCFACGKAMETPAPGAYAYAQPPYHCYPQPKQTNIMAIIGLVCAFLMPLAGIVVSIIARRQCIENREEGQGLATAGIIISAVQIAIWLIVTIALIVFTFAYMGSYDMFSYLI